MTEYDRDQHFEPRLGAEASGEQRNIVEKSPADGVSEFAQHGDPSRRQQLTLSGGERVRSEIVWMRPTELVPAVTGRAAGQGIDLGSSLARRARALPVQGVAATRRAFRERALRLPPATAFGNRRAAHRAVRRSGLGR